MTKQQQRFEDGMGLAAKFLRFGAKNPNGSYIDAQTQLCWMAYRLGANDTAQHFAKDTSAAIDA